MTNGARDAPIGIVVLAMACLTAGGCANFHRVFDMPLPQTGRVQDGKAHYRDVLQELGPPAKVSAMEDDMVFLYETAKLVERQIGIEIRYEEIPILKAVYGRGQAEGQTAVFVFDSAGTLRSQGLEAWQRSLGSGQAVQLFLSLAEITSSGGYDEKPAANYWGADLLKSRVTRALNRHSSLETGQNGVERKGSPKGAGQHALETIPFYVE